MELEITNEFKEKVITALLNQRGNYGGSDAGFAKQWGIDKSVFSRLKGGERGNLIKDSQWINIARTLGVNPKDSGLKVTRTDVLNMIEDEVSFCQENSKAMIFVDDSEIGKTIAARHLAMTRKNCFYVDGSQAKTKQRFIRLIAKTIGIDNDGKYADVKENIKYYLKNVVSMPIVIIDDAGDLDSNSFLEIKELWNATEGACGWYMIGDDSLRSIIEKAMRSKKAGFKALFSRFSSNYSSITPLLASDKIHFYKKLIADVLSANMTDKTKLNEIVAKCIKHDNSGHIGGLRRAESLLILTQIAS